MSEYKIGDKVLVRDERLDDLRAPFRRRVEGRIGEVVGLSYPNGMPIVEFPAAGRKRHFRFGIVPDSMIQLAGLE